MILSSPSEEYIIYFSNVNFCEFFFLGLLHFIIKDLIKQGIHIELNITGGAASYLNTIFITNGKYINEQNEVQFLDKFQYKNYLPIIYYPCTGYWDNEIIPREVCIQKLLDLICKKTNAGTGLQHSISFIVDELSNNIKDHSESDYGIIFSQYYHDRRLLDIFIADNGVSIFESYKKTNAFNPQSNEDALRFMIEGKSSKNDVISRGFGVPESINKIVNSGDNARYIVWSKNSIYLNNHGNASMINLNTYNNYNGCITFIRLQC